MSGHKVTAILLALLLSLPGLFLPACDFNDLLDTNGETHDSGTDPIDEEWLPPVSTEQEWLPGIADVVASTRPAVVAINTEIAPHGFGGPTQQGAGSGWIIDEQGLIVTNNHVIEGARSITVTLVDNRTLTATRVRGDDLTDLAILKVDAEDLPALSIGNSSRSRVGDWVVAIGNPLDLGISAKEGIISRFGVSAVLAEGQSIHDLIEISAAINPGNSGGPLINMAGEVIGITSLKIAQIGIEGMGYAIDINAAVPVLHQLVAGGCVDRAWLGLDSVDVNESVAARYQLAVDGGAMVTHVADNSPAGRAGIEERDVITGYDGREVPDSRTLTELVSSSVIGEPVEIELWRGEARMEIEALPAERPPCEY